MEAIVLAGGLGTRLRAVVSDVPKPMAPVRGRPFLAWLLEGLAVRGVQRVVLATGYRGELIEQHFGARFAGLDLAYSREPEPLGTGGAIALALGQAREQRVFVVNGDTFLAMDYAAMDSARTAAGVRLALAVVEVPDAARYGRVLVDADSRVLGFEEKGRAGRGLINAGVYLLDRALLAGRSPAARFSFETDVLEPHAARERALAFHATGPFIDIGVPEDYARVQTLELGDGAA